MLCSSSSHRSSRDSFRRSFRRSVRRSGLPLIPKLASALALPLLSIPLGLIAHGASAEDVRAEAPGAARASVDRPALEAATGRVERDVAWLADDAREGRGIGTDGLAQAEAWLVERFEALGLDAVGEDGYRDAFDVPLRAVVKDGTELVIGGEVVPRDAYAVTSFSGSGTVEAEIVPVGYGITAPDLTHDDYADAEGEPLDVAGKIVAVRRFVPPGARFDEPRHERQYGDLRYKAFNAREHGAAAVLIVDLPKVAPGETMEDEAKLPDSRVDAKGDTGLPVMVLRREAGAALFDRAADAQPLRANVTVDQEIETARAYNVVGRVPAGASDAVDGAVLVGAHFDHLGFGGSGSLDPDSKLPHNGADDNASGTAALLEIGRELMARRGELRRPVWLIAFSGEESGLVGSTTFVRAPTGGLEVEDLVAMVNLDMVGRLREDRVSVLGSDSATEWYEILAPLCERRGLECILGGDGYGPSDQTPFYAAGVPVVHWFTGTHDDYHKPSDDAELVNAEGTARIAHAVTELVVEVASRPEPLTHVVAEAPAPGGDMRSFGASLGTIPDYVGDDRPGVLLAGTRPGSAAERAGIRKGDLLVGLMGRDIRDIYDFVYVLRSAKPGETAEAVVLRGDERVEVEVTFDEGKR